MPGIILLPIESHDLGEVAVCWEAAAKFDPCNEALLREKILEDDGVFPTLRVAARQHDRIVGICVGAIRETADGRRGFVKLLAVRPEARRQGVGTALLQGVERALISAGAPLIRISESAPNYLSPGIDSQDELTLAFFRHHGYAEIGEACNLRVDLYSTGLATAMCAAWQASRVGSMTVRRATTTDGTAVERFIGKYWPAWLPEVQQTYRNAPVSLHIALREEPHAASHVVGFAAYDANNRGTGWFGPMGTDPSCEGKGIGRVLLLKCLWDMHKQGRSVVTIPWVAPVGFYQRHAQAEIDRRFVRLEKRAIRTAPRSLSTDDGREV